MEAPDKHRRRNEVTPWLMPSTLPSVATRTPDMHARLKLPQARSLSDDGRSSSIATTIQE